MSDPRERPQFDFPLNTGNGYNRNEEDLYLDEIKLDEDLDDQNDDQCL